MSHFKVLLNPRHELSRFTPAPEVLPNAIVDPCKHYWACFGCRKLRKYLPDMAV